LELLKDVQKLQESVGVPGDVAYTCETAGYFFLYHVLARWEEFLSKVRPSDDKVKNILAVLRFLLITYKGCRCERHQG